MPGRFTAASHTASSRFLGVASASGLGIGASRSRMRLDVTALNIVHPGPSEAEVSYPYEPTTPEGTPRVRTHRNARTTPKGRALMVERVTNLGWTVEAVALASGVSRRTVYKWIGRHRSGGVAALEDCASTPLRRPHRTRGRLEKWIADLRGRRLSSPAIARKTGIARSTVGNVLRREGLGRL